MIVELFTYILGGKFIVKNNTNSNCISVFWTESNPRSTAKLSIINRSKAARNNKPKILFLYMACLSVDFEYTIGLF